AWIAIAKMAGNSYVDVFRDTLRRKMDNRLKKNGHSKNKSDTETPGTVRELLHSDQQSDILR
ncbi:MAG: hypothetical protein GWN00_33895, partial [Aliifodinibius sp.]|nr:hypothetical protein [Fodinibius sp.]NIV15746.1 hypothetical protein [Fodinibius sp.]NIY29601.1 hypothetical protein [Fodinibius sp.]